MKRIVFISVFLLLACTVFAGGGKDGERAIAWNWYVQGGGGVNTVFNSSSFGAVGAAAELRAGWWTSPFVGVRAGVGGIHNRPNGTELGWFSGEDRFGYWHGDADIMWHLSNTLGGARDDRRVNVYPFARFSGILSVTEDGRAVEAAGGAGVQAAVRLSKRIDLYVETSALAAREKAWRQQGGVAVFPTLTAGVTVRVGKQGFRRGGPSEIIYEPVYVDRVDTVTVKEKEIVVDTVSVVDSVLIKQMRETPLTLYFEIDKTFLTDREKAHLERYAHFVLTPESKVRLVGSADKETGNPDRNQKLSEGRCAMVKSILMSVYGLKSANIECIANGDRKNEFNTPEKNRCVTLYIIDPEW